VLDDALPIHPRTGLRAVGIVSGRPVWPILGASPDDPSNDDEPTDEPDDEPTDEPNEDEPKGADQLGDPGKRALDSMKAQRNSARQKLKDLETELKQFRDKDKTEVERLADNASSAQSRAEQAEARSKALEIALERAPAHASLAQVRAVAKRVRGGDDDELNADADELFELLAPKPADDGDKPKESAKRSLPGKPKERLRGGADPEEPVEETDPRKLAALIRRER
jgi:hypothetical protein